MSKPISIIVTEQTVAVTKPVKVYSISFVSDDEDFHVKLIDGGAYLTGTVVFYIKLEMTTQIGENLFSADFGEEGLDFTAGLNINITKDGTTGAADGGNPVNIAYKDLSVG